MKKLGSVILCAFILATSACSSAPNRAMTNSCSNSDKNVTYMTDMQQYEVERFAMRHEFRPGCVSAKLAELKEQQCLTAATLSYQQWMSIYSSCAINNP